MTLVHMVERVNPLNRDMKVGTTFSEEGVYVRGYWWVHEMLFCIQVIFDISQSKSYSCIFYRQVQITL